MLSYLRIQKRAKISKKTRRAGESISVQKFIGRDYGLRERTSPFLLTVSQTQNHSRHFIDHFIYKAIRFRTRVPINLHILKPLKNI